MAYTRWPLLKGLQAGIAGSIVTLLLFPVLGIWSMLFGGAWVMLVAFILTHSEEIPHE